MKKFFNIMLMCLSIMSLSACGVEDEASTDSNPNTSIPSVEPSINDKPSCDETTTVVPSVEDELNSGLRKLISDDIKSYDRLKGLDKLEPKKINEIVIDTLDKMINGEIYYCNNEGIRFKDNTLMKAQANWAGFYYENNNRYVTGNKLTLEVRQNGMLHKGFYITPERISDVDMELIKTSYIETEFNSEGYGLIYKDNMIIDDDISILNKMKELAINVEPMIEEDFTGYRIVYSPEDMTDSLIIKDSYMQLGRFSNYFLDIDEMINEIKICLDNIKFYEYEGDSLFPDGENPLFDDQRAKNALLKKLNISLN